MSTFIKLFVGFIFLIAILAGIFALTMPRDQILKLIIFRDFFDVSLPILAFGALIKYLFTFNGRDKHYHDH